MPLSYRTKQFYTICRAIQQGRFSAISLIQSFDNHDARIRYRLKQKIRLLENLGIINLTGDIVHLTQKGKQILKLHSIDDISIESKEKWNKVWHLVSWDVPIRLRGRGSILHQQVLKWGLSKIHSSLWAYPWEFKEEIAIFAKENGLSKYIIYMTTDHIPQEKYLIEKYKLSS